jgi:hypothetical protein
VNGQGNKAGNPQQKAKKKKAFKSRWKIFRDRCSPEQQALLDGSDSLRNWTQSIIECSLNKSWTIEMLHKTYLELIDGLKERMAAYVAKHSGKAPTKVEVQKKEGQDA